MSPPSKKTPEVVEEIVMRLSRGEPLAKICADDHMPDFSTVWRWEEDDEAFRKVSLRARMHGTHFMADDCIAIADSAELEPADKRVRIDTRLRLIGKWNAKVYGEKTLVGSDPDNPLPQSIDLTKVSDDALKVLREIAENAMKRND